MNAAGDLRSELLAQVSTRNEARDGLVDASSQWPTGGKTEKTVAAQWPGAPDAVSQARVDHVQQSLEQAQRVLREHSSKVNVKRARVGDVEAMTWDEYNALPVKEKAAIDFNSMLVRARGRDLKLQEEYDPNKKQRATYDKAVSAAFGEDGGSETYAPETMAVLRQINFKDQSSDLDDFLNLSAAITVNDLKHLDVGAGPGAVTGSADSEPMNPVQVDRYSLTQHLANSTAQMQNALAKGNDMLATMNQTALVDRNQDVARILGGISKGPGTVLGFGPPNFDPATDSPNDLNSYFQRAFDMMASAKAHPDQIMSAMASERTPEEIEAFYTYADTRTRDAGLYGTDIGGDPQVNYSTPEELRAALGIGVKRGAINGPR